MPILEGRPGVLLFHVFNVVFREIFFILQPCQKFRGCLYLREPNGGNGGWPFSQAQIVHSSGDFLGTWVNLSQGNTCYSHDIQMVARFLDGRMELPDDPKSGAPQKGDLVDVMSSVLEEHFFLLP
jgi:hypothetical protein